MTNNVQIGAAKNAPAQTQTQAPTSKSVAQAQRDASTTYGQARPLTAVEKYSRGNRRYRTAASDVAVTETYNYFKKRIEEAADDIASFSVTPFVGSNFGIAASGVILHRKFDDVVVYHFIAVASACQVRPKTIDLGHGQKSEVRRTVADLFNNEVFAVIDAEVAKAYVGKKQPTSVIDTHITVLQDETDKESLLLASVDTIFDIAAATGNFEEDIFEVSILSESINRALVTYNGAPTIKADGLPCRNDISIEITAKPNNQVGIDAAEQREEPICVTSGFVNLIYAPAQPQYIHPGQPPVQPTQMFEAEYILTAVESIIGPQSLEMLFFGIYGATAALHQDNWKNVFRPINYSKKDINLRDIGALGYEINFTGDANIDGKKINTATEDFLSEGLWTLTRDLIKPELGFAIDIEDSGPQSALQSVFIRLLSADATVAAKAYGEIMEALDNLTGGRFTKAFNGNIVVPVAERVHTGTYQRNDGELYDLRELDPLAMRNIHGAKNMETLIAYERTFTDSVNEELRLMAREDIMTNSLGVSTKVTGTAQRFHFTGDFITALIQTITVSGAAISIDGVQQINAPYERGQVQYAGQGVNATVLNGAFNATAHAQPGMQTHRGRW